DAARSGHRAHVAVAIAADLPRRALLIEDETLDMALMIEAHEIRLIVHLLPRNGLLLVPVIEQHLDARLVLDGFDVLMAADAFAQARNSGNRAAPRVRVTVHAVDSHFFHVDIVGKFDGLRDDGPERVVAVGCLAADGPALLKRLVR